MSCFVNEVTSKGRGPSQLYLIQIEAIYFLPDTALKSQIAMLKLQIISKLQL